MLKSRQGLLMLLALGAFGAAGCDGASDNYGAPSSPPSGPATVRTGDNVRTGDGLADKKGDEDRHDVGDGVAATQDVDNTGRNERDRDGTTLTPLDQSEDPGDVDITARVRRAILDDETMSANADNCKIITNHGVVTLRGVVDSEAERVAVEAKAKALAGVQRVDNQLEVQAAH